MRTYLVDVQGDRSDQKVTAVLVIGPKELSREDKTECLNAVVRLVDAGWPVAANSSTVVGRLVRRSAQMAGGVFVEIGRSPSDAGVHSAKVPNMVISTNSRRGHHEVGLR
jgi:hypothetical protein